MRHMELIPDDLQCASVLLFMLLLLILAFLAGAYLANRGAWTGIFLHDPLTKGMKPIHFFSFFSHRIRPCFKIELMKYRKIFISKLKICSRLSACGRAPVSLTAHKRMLIC